MKLLSLTLLVAAALATVAQGYPDTGFEPVGAGGLHLRRSLADGSSAGPSPSPTPTTAHPSSAPPVSPSPSPSPPAATPSPSPSAGPTPTPAPGTPAPGTPAPGTPAPGSGSGTTLSPTTTAPTSSPSDPTPVTVSPNTKIPLSTGSSSGSRGTRSTRTPAPNTSSSGTTTDANTESDSKLSTGAIVGIVGGIVAGVAILAFVTMTLIRRKRETEDDPLSPFELSMDKGYAGAQGYGGNAAAAGAAGAQRNAPGHTQELGLTDTPPAGAIAAGVAYSQFYDQATSPGSLNHTRQVSTEHEPAAAAADNSTNLWMSAMEAQNGNDSYLSAKESRDNDSLNSGGRNSYDIGYADDQSSQISGSSDLNSAKDFPDYDDESARGSYEL